MPWPGMRKAKNRAGAQQATAWSRLKSRAVARFSVTKHENNNSNTNIAPTPPTTGPKPQQHRRIRRLLSCFMGPEEPKSTAPPTETPESYGPNNIKPESFLMNKELGAGGQGAVYAARYPQREQIPGAPEEFALKVAELNEQKERYQQLAFREYRLHRMVSGHPHITTMYTGFSSDVPYLRAYLLTELLNGGDLQKLWEHWKDGLPINRALEIITQLCDALAHMHQQGVAHCDLKPAKVLLAHGYDATGNNVAKLVDFGLAVEFTRARDGSPQKTRIIGGTCSYMSPEALQNRSLDPTKLDMYSVGIILCILLSGRKPFAVPKTERKNREALLRARLELDLEQDFMVGPELE